MVIEEIREEVLSVSNSEPNVIQENSLQGGPFITVPLFFQIFYLLVPKIKIGLKYFLAKNSKKQLY